MQHNGTVSDLREVSRVDGVGEYVGEYVDAYVVGECVGDDVGEVVMAVQST